MAYSSKTVHVTFEPCIMCAGLMYQTCVDRCAYVATDAKVDALGTLFPTCAESFAGREVPRNNFTQPCFSRLKK